GQNHRRAVQRALANRTVLQVDQTEPEDQSLCRDEPQRRNDPDLDRVVRQPLGGLFEVHQPVCVLRAAAPASAAAQPLCETKPLRTPLSTATAISPPEATPAGAALNLWDSSGIWALIRIIRLYALSAECDCGRQFTVEADKR